MTRVTNSFLFFLFSIMLFSPSASAQSCTTATCTAASTAESDVLAALPSSSNTNSTVTVTIPSGTSSWTSQLNYTVPAAVTNLTIRGQTTVNCTGTAGASSYVCTPADSTIIVDAYQKACCNNQILTINVGGNTSTVFRFTGLTFKGGNIGSTSNQPIPMVMFTGTSYNFRLDHNHFDMTTFTPSICCGAAVRTDGLLQGVFDHNVANQPDIGIFDSLYSQDVAFGDTTWGAPSNWGTAQAVFFESNYVVGGMMDDCEAGARAVMRYNTVLNASQNGGSAFLEHSTGQGQQRYRGCRLGEIYHNYFSNTTTNPESAVDATGGPEMVWANTIVGAQHTASGHTSRQDGVHSQSSIVSGVSTAPPGNWGYCGTSAINPNTGTANGVGSAWDGNTNTSTGYPCLDQTGRGQADLLDGAYFSGAPEPVDSVTHTVTWPHQFLEPVYMWNNTVTSGTNNFVNNIGTITSNVDILWDCGSANPVCTGGFTGAAGTGFGALANRPSTCTAGPGGTYYTSPTGSYGVAYFATDANGGRGELYVCTSTNTWTPVYEPYTYPHPLTVGNPPASSSSPAPPANLLATVQ